MSTTLTRFLALTMTWSLLIGVGLFLADVSPSSLTGVVVLAVLYMPSPFVAAVVAERGLVRERFRLPHGGLRPVLVFLLAPVVLVVATVLLHLAVVALAGDLLGIPGLGTVAATGEEIAAGATGLLGEEAVAAAGPPPPFLVLLLAGVVGAVVAGWTLNGLFAMGEEYGWRGLMWDELRHHGVVRANLLIGLAWGLWHAPVVVQGYNYPGHPVLGVVAMVIFCTGMSFALTAVRELTGSVLPVAAAHGMFNALAPLLLLLAPGASPVLGGPVGLLGALALGLLGAGLWAFVARSGRGADAGISVAHPRPAEPRR